MKCIMKSIRSFHCALRLLAGVAIVGVVTAGAAHANPRMGGVVVAPPPPPPRVNTGGISIYSVAPRIDVRSVGPSMGPGSTAANPSTNSGASSGRSSTFGPTGSPPKSEVKGPRTETKQMTMTGADGRPILGPDGKPATVPLIKNNVDITPSMKRDVLADESRKYGSGTYTVVDPNSQPTRKQDCGGNAVQNVFGIPDVVVPAHRFHQDIVVKSGAQEITNNDAGEVDWSKTKKNDTGVIWWGDGPDGKKGQPGHIITVKDPETGTIITKDGHERVMEGKFKNGDDLHNAYNNGRVVIFRIDPKIKMTPQVATNTKTSKR
jgi:hypothetical protein